MPLPVVLVINVLTKELVHALINEHVFQSFAVTGKEVDMRLSLT